MRMTVALSDDALGELVIGDGSNSLDLTSYDLGVAVSREVASNKPGTNGTVDGTSLAGGRVMTFGVRSRPYSLADMDALAAFTRQSLRPVVTVFDDEAMTAPRRAVGRVSPFANQATARQFRDRERLFVLQVVVASGLLESAELHLQPILPGTPVGGLAIPTAGLAIPTAGLALTSPGVPGFGVVVNAGAADAPAILRLHGPFGDTSSDETVIAHAESGGQIVFSNLQVAANDYVEVDLDTHRITLNGMSSQSRRSFRDSSQTRWFWLAPGDNRISFLPETFAAPSQLEVLWRDSY